MHFDITLIGIVKERISDYTDQGTGPLDESFMTGLMELGTNSFNFLLFFSRIFPSVNTQVHAKKVF